MRLHSPSKWSLNLRPQHLLRKVVLTYHPTQPTRLHLYSIWKYTRSILKIYLPTMSLPGPAGSFQAKRPKRNNQTKATVLDRKFPSEGFKAKDPRRNSLIYFQANVPKRTSQVEVVKRKFPSEFFQAKDHQRKFPIERSKVEV